MLKVLTALRISYRMIEGIDDLVLRIEESNREVRVFFWVIGEELEVHSIIFFGCSRV